VVVELMANVGAVAVSVLEPRRIGETYKTEPIIRVIVTGVLLKRTGTLEKSNEFVGILINWSLVVEATFV